MKKSLILLIALLVQLSLNAEDVVSLSEVNEPEWKDFAPSAYVDVSEPRGFGKLNETASYWYGRRVAFEEGIVNCRALDAYEEKIGCYQQLKVRQYQLNSDYNARIEAQDQARLGPQEMFDRTDTMLPIGGYLNTFTKFQPNELQ